MRERTERLRQYLSLGVYVHKGLLLGYIVEGALVSSSSCLLVFDSDPAVHQLLGDVLKRSGRSIQDVYDRREALHCLRHTHCDLVLAG
jgi:hypothetical protein